MDFVSDPPLRNNSVKKGTRQMDFVCDPSLLQDLHASKIWWPRWSNNKVMAWTKEN